MPASDVSGTFEGFDMGTIHLDRSMRITYANASAAAVLQAPLRSLKGRPLRDIIAAPLLDRLSEGLVRAAETHSSVRLEARLPSSGRRWISFHCLSTKKGFTLVLKGITGEKRAEEELRAPGSDYRAIFDAANDAIFIHDIRTGAILDVNRKMTERYGYTAEEARRLTVGDLSSGVPPYTQEEALEKIREVLSDGELLFEWHSKDKSGNLFWEEINLKKALINGELRIVAVARDITERKRIQEALEESRRSLSTLMSNLPGMAYRCRNDAHWTMEFVSDGCTELTGCLPDDLVENRILSYASLIHPDDRRRVWDSIQKALDERSPFRMEYRIRTADEQEKWVWEQGRGIFSRKGDLVALEGFITDITERKQMEERLLESERRLKLAQQWGHVGIFDWDMKAGRHNWTDEMKEVYRLPPDFDGSFENWKKIVHPDDLARVFRNVEHAAREHRREVEGDYRIVYPDGSVRWYMDRGVIFYDESGNPAHIIGTTVDITDRKKAEEDLRRANEELDLKVKKRARSLAETVDKLKEQKNILQTILDSIPVMLIFLDAEGKISLINKEMERRSGWSLEEARTMDLIAAGFPDESVRNDVLASIREGRPGWRVHEAMSRSGEISPGLWTNVRLADGSVIGIGIDISERRKMERDLQRLVTAIEQAGDGVVLLNPDWVIEYVNPAFEQISGYGRGELIGRAIDSADESFLCAAGCENFKRVPMEGKTWNSRQRRQKKSGEIVEMDLTVSPVHDDKGRIVNFVSVVRDVTRETALNQQIAQSQKLEAIGTLAGGIAHDLKNIFTPIVLNTEIALMDIDTDHPAYPLLEEIQEAARLGSDLTKQIVTFSRRSLKEKAPLPITPIIEESLSFLRSTLPSTITIHSRLRAGRAHVLADPTQIKQVMINLGNNAGHAMREQGGELYIELTREILGAKTASEISPDLSPGHYVRIVVRDTGEGMDEKTMQRIFDPFFTTKAKSEGTGMGLSVVHGIVRDHRGAITVRSTPGKGSSFTVFLPRLKSPGGRRRLTSDSPRRG